MASEKLPLALETIVQDANVRLKNGTLTAPSLAFSTDLTTGLYTPVTNNIVVSTGGQEITRFTPSSIEFSKPLCMTDQIPVTPVVATLGCLYKKADNTGLFWNTLIGGEVQVTGGFALAWPLQATDVAGNALEPSFSFTADEDTGMYLSAVGTLALTVGGAARLSLTNAQVTLAVPLNLDTNNIIGVSTMTASGAITGGSLIAGNLALNANTLTATGPLTLASSTDQVLLPANPTVPLGATTKQYVDALLSGLTFKEAVRVKTVALLPAHTAVGAGVGKTLTMNANAILTIDGVATVLNDRILVDNTGTLTAVDRGIYTVTTVGAAGTQAVLTRSIDADEDAEVTSGMFVFVTRGTTSQNNGFVLLSNDPIVVDTTPQSYTQYTSVSSDSASNVGTGISLFKQKTLNNFEFNSVSAATPKITVVLDAGNNNIGLDVNESSVNHNALFNLAVGDPHAQYMLKAGTTMTGNLNMGTNSITNALALTASGGVTGGSLSAGNLTLAANTFAAIGPITFASSTNQVLLLSDPTVNLGVATKQYVDAIATASMPVAGGTMAGPFLADAGGTAALPAVAFDTDANTGMYRAAADIIGFSTAGTQRLSISAIVMTSAVNLAMSNNNITDVASITADTVLAGNLTLRANALSTVGDLTLSSDTNQVLLTTDPTANLGVATKQYVDGFLPLTGGSLTGTLVLNSSASPAVPDISFAGDTNTGFYLAGAEAIGMSTNGVLRTTINTNLTLASTTNLVFTEPAGVNTITLAAPVLPASYTLTLPTTDGNPSEVLTTNGVGNLSWSAAAAGAALPLIGGTMTGTILADDAGTAALPAIAFNSDPNTGMYRTAADAIGLSTNGVLRLTVSDDLLKLSSINTEYTAQTAASVSNATAANDFVLFFDSSNDNSLSYKNSVGAVVDVELAGGDNFGNHMAIAQLQAINGTAVAPAVTFVSDLDTGMFRNRPNSIGFATNGLLRLTIDDISLISSVNIVMGNNNITGATLITASGAITGGSLLAGNLTLSGNALTAAGSLTLTSNTDQVLLAADPTVDLGVATKQYVDGFLPLIGGTLTGNTTLGSTANLIFTEPAGTDTITLTAPVLATSYTLTLPTTDGNPNEVLTTSGTGTLSWSAGGGGGGGAALALDGTTTMTGAISAAVGTALLPSLYFNGDTNTGLYQTAVDAIGVATNGALRLTVNDNGMLLNAVTAPATVAAGQTAVYTETANPNKLMVMGENDVAVELTNQDRGHKRAVHVATTGNVGLTGAGPVIIGGTIDTIVLAAGDLVLVKNQTATAANGVYIVNAVAATAPDRAPGFSALDQFELGTKVLIVNGTTSSGKTFYTSVYPAVLGTNPWIWTPIGQDHMEYLASAAISAGDIIASSTGGNVSEFVAPFNNDQVISPNTPGEAGYAAAYDPTTNKMLFGFMPTATDYRLVSQTVAADGTLSVNATLTFPIPTFSGSEGEPEPTVINGYALINVGTDLWCLVELRIGPPSAFTLFQTPGVTLSSVAGGEFATPFYGAMDIVHNAATNRTILAAATGTEVHVYVITHTVNSIAISAPVTILTGTNLDRNIKIVTYSTLITVASMTQYRTGIIDTIGNTVGNLGNTLTEPIVTASIFTGALNPTGMQFNTITNTIECHRNQLQSELTTPPIRTYPVSLGVSGRSLAFVNSASYAFGGYPSTRLLYSTMYSAMLHTGVAPVTGRLTGGMYTHSNNNNQLLFRSIHPSVAVNVGVSNRHAFQWVWEDTTNNRFLMAYSNNTTNTFGFSTYTYQEFDTFIGIAQNDALAGEIVHVAVRGTTSTAHTGLTPNTKYYIDPNNPTVLTTNSTHAALAGFAISSTKLVLAGPN